ncbi:MAG: hypothetical protein Cons2KO_19210 [Congregibacter sp.]
MNRLYLLAGLTFFAAPSYPAEWTTGAQLNLQSSYSTNVCRRPNDEQDEVYSTVTPTLNVRGEGSRARLALVAGVEYNSLAEKDVDCSVGGVGGIGDGGAFVGVGAQESWVPRLNFTGEMEAVENLLFFEADAFATQNAINPFVTGGDDNLSATGNVNITSRWGAGARIDRQWQESWQALLRYRYNEQFNSVDQLFGDSEENRFDLIAGMIPGTSRITFNLQGNYSEVTFSETERAPESSNRLSRLELRSVLQLSNSWQATAAYGEESNAFLSAADEVEGHSWDVGFRWAPNSRVIAEAGYGERFFGEAPRASLQYRHKRSVLTVSYLRDLQFPRNIRGADGSFDPDDPFGPGSPGSGQPGSNGPTVVGQSPVLNEIATINYLFQTRRMNFFIDFRDSRQTRASDGGGADFFQINVNADRRISQKLTLEFNTAYIENSGTFDADEVVIPQGRETWQGRVGLRRALANRASVFVRYEYQEQSDTSGNLTSTFNEFEEHRILFGIQFGFGQGNTQTGVGVGMGVGGVGLGGIGGGGFSF